MIIVPIAILKSDEDGIVLDITANGETKSVNLLGGLGTLNNFEEIEVGGLEIALRFGSRLEQLPFSIKLNDFIAEKYPGTEKAYSSYESKVTVIDKENGDFDYRIFNDLMKQFIKRIFQTLLGISLLLLISGFVITYFFSEKLPFCTCYHIYSESRGKGLSNCV